MFFYKNYQIKSDTLTTEMVGANHGKMKGKYECGEVGGRNMGNSFHRRSFGLSLEGSKPQLPGDALKLTMEK